MGSRSREFNRLQAEATAGRAVRSRELAKVERQIRNIIEAIKEGMFVPAMKGEMAGLEARKAALEAEAAIQPEPLPAIHPGVIESYRRKVGELAAALNDDDARSEAAEVIRSLVGAIRLVPTADGLAIELAGELAAILALGNEQRPRPEGAGAWSTTLVAGA